MQIYPKGRLIIMALVQLTLLVSLLIWANIQYDYHNSIFLEYQCMSSSNLCISVFSRIDDSIPPQKAVYASFQEPFKVLEMGKQVQLKHQEYFHFVNYENNPEQTQQIIFDELTVFQDFNQEFDINIIQESTTSYMMMPNVRRCVFYRIKLNNQKIHLTFANNLSIQIIKWVCIGLSVLSGIILGGFVFYLLIKKELNMLNKEQFVYAGMIIGLLFLPIFKKVTPIRELILREIANGVFWVGSLRYLSISFEKVFIIALVHAVPFRMQINILTQFIFIIYYVCSTLKDNQWRRYSELYLWTHLLILHLNNVYWRIANYYCVDTNQRIVQVFIIEFLLVFNLILSYSELQSQKKEGESIENEEEEVLSMKTIEMSNTDFGQKDSVTNPME